MAVVALAAALIYTRVVMIPFVVALFIVALVSPIEDFQVKWLRLPRIIAIVVTLLVVMAVIALVFLLIAQAITTIVSTAGEYSASFENMANKIIETIEYIYPEGGTAARRGAERRRAVAAGDAQQCRAGPGETGAAGAVPDGGGGRQDRDSGGEASVASPGRGPQRTQYAGRHRGRTAEEGSRESTPSRLSRT